MGTSALPACCSSQSAVESLYRMSRADRRHFRHFGWSLYRKEALKNDKLRDKSPKKESCCSDFIWCPSKTAYFSCCSARPPTSDRAPNKCHSCLISRMSVSKRLQILTHNFSGTMRRNQSFTRVCLPFYPNCPIEWRYTGCFLAWQKSLLITIWSHLSFPVPYRYFKL